MITKRKPLQFNLGEAPVIPEEPPAAQKARLTQVGARIPREKYREMKVRAAMAEVTVQTLVEQAIDEFLANHPRQ